MTATWYQSAPQRTKDRAEVLGLSSRGWKIAKIAAFVGEDRNHFLLMNEGWDGKKRIHHCLIHVQILNEKI